MADTVSDNARRLAKAIMEGQYAGLDTSDFETYAPEPATKFSGWNNLTGEQKKKYMLIGGAVLGVVAVASILGGVWLYKRNHDKKK